MKLRGTLTACVVALVAGALATPGKASTAAETFVTLIGEPGAGVIGEQKLFYSGSAEVSVHAGASSIVVGASGGNLGQEYTLRFDAPPGETFHPGEYEHAGEFPEDGRPALALSGEGRACGSGGGRFRIESLAPGSVWIVFEFRCGASAPAVLGEVRYQVPGDGGEAIVGPRIVRWPDADPAQYDMHAVPVAVLNPTPAAVGLGQARIEGPAASEFSVRLDECAGETLDPGESCLVWVRYLPTSPGPKNASLVIPESGGAPHLVSLEGLVFGGTTRFAVASAPGDPLGRGDQYDYTPANARIYTGGTVEAVHASVESADGDEWEVHFYAPPGEQLEAGRKYEAVVSTWEPQPGRAAMDIVADSTGCGGDAAGEFTVAEIEASGPEQIGRFGVEFEFRCGSYPPLRGILDYRAVHPHEPPPPYPGRHSRSVSIRLTAANVSGRVSVASGPTECIAGVPIVIEKRHRDGTVTRVGRTRTDDFGAYGKELPVHGTYRARTPRKTLGGGGSTCLAARSRFRTRG